MIKRLTFFVILFGTVGGAPAWSQSTDMAAERGRLANQRIQLEAERVAQEEKERAAQAERDRALATKQEADQAAAGKLSKPAEQRPDATSDAVPVNVATPQAGGQGGDPGMSRMLEQIRMLGELRDSGYVTNDEFDRIKRKILDGEL